MDSPDGERRPRVGWRERKKWSDQYLPEVKSRLGRALLREGSWEEDAKEATDLIVLKMDPIRVGCRIRKFEWLPCEGEFTLRYELPSGMPTEYEKIVLGFGTHFFYGFAGPEHMKPALAAWMILDLDVFRAEEGFSEWQQKSDSYGILFRVYHVDKFSPDLVIERRHPMKFNDGVLEFT